MIKSATTILTLFCALITFSQGQLRVDSLPAKADKVSSPIDAVDTYISIATEYGWGDTLKSHYYLREALQIADSIKYQNGIADALYVFGRNLMLIGDYERSRKFLDQLIVLSKNTDYQYGLSNGLFGMAWLNYYRGEYEVCIELHQESLGIRRGLGHEESISASLRGLGIAYKLMGDFDRALTFLEESLQIEQAIDNQSGVAECLNHMGIISGLKGNYPEALDAHYQALEILEKGEDKSGLAYTYQNIGIVHKKQGELEKTLKYYEQSLAIREALGERRSVAQILYNIGLVYHEKNGFQEALKFYEKALTIKQELGDRRGVADGYLNIGKLYADQGKFEEAIEYQLNALGIADLTNSVWSKVNALVGLGSSYASLGSYQFAKEYLDEAVLLATQSNLMESTKEAAKQLSMVEKELGNYKSAFEAQALYYQILDSISSEEMTKQFAMIEAENKFRQKRDSIQFANEKERLILDRQLSEQKNAQIATVVTAVILLVLLIVLYGYYRFKSQAIDRLSQLNRQIQQSNDSLQLLNEEKNNLIGIVAHDLKNPLSAIMGAISVMRKEDLNESNRTMKDLIEEASSRMLGMITDILNVQSVEKSLEEKMALKSYDLSVAVVQVVDQFKPAADQKKIALEMELDDEVTALADERFIIQVIENLVSNALKFSPTGKKVKVFLHDLAEKVKLEVRDEGPGLSREDKKKLFKRFQRLSAKPTGDENSTGLGLSIVKEVVNKMGGKVWAESELGEGTSFYVELLKS